MSILKCVKCGKEYSFYQLHGVHKKNSTCPDCNNKLKYIGDCGECMDFLEYYNGVGLCCVSNKKKNKDNPGCNKFN